VWCMKRSGSRMGYQLMSAFVSGPVVLSENGFVSLRKSAVCSTSSSSFSTHFKPLTQVSCHSYYRSKGSRYCGTQLSNRSAKCSSHLVMKTQMETDWNVVEVVENSKAAENLRYIVIKVGTTFEKGSLCDSYRIPGMFVQIKPHNDPETKPAFFAIGCAPNIQGYFEFLVKEADSTKWFWTVKEGDKVEMSPIMGKGFPMSKLDMLGFPAIPEDSKPTDILLIATGTGVAPMRACIESMLNGLRPETRRVVKLYYGCKNPSHLAYKDRFKLWKGDNVSIIPVFSESDVGLEALDDVKSFIESPKVGMYVQDALKLDGIQDPKKTAVLLVGQKEMTETVTQFLTETGVSADRILLNF